MTSSFDQFYLGILMVRCSGEPYTPSGFRYCPIVRSTLAEVEKEGRGLVALAFSQRVSWPLGRELERLVWEACLDAGKKGSLDTGRLSPLQKV